MRKRIPESAWLDMAGKVTLGLNWHLNKNIIRHEPALYRIETRATFKLKNRVSYPEP